jgi:hypothetical protein
MPPAELPDSSVPKSGFAGVAGEAAEMMHFARIARFDDEADIADAHDGGPRGNAAMSKRHCFLINGLGKAK